MGHLDPAESNKQYLYLIDIETLREIATNMVEEVAEQGTTLTPAQKEPEGLMSTRCMSLRQLLVLFQPQIFSRRFLIYL